MWGGKPKEQKKQRQRHPLPAEFMPVACAYVYRLHPKQHKGVTLATSIGRFDFITDIYGLQRSIAAATGGGRYRARFHEQDNTKVYVGTETLTVPGEPRIDGRSAAPGEELKAEARQKAERLLEQVQHERAKLEVEREQRLVDIETLQRLKRESLLLQKINAMGNRGSSAARSGGVNVHGKRPGPGSGTLGRGIARPR